MQGAVDSRCSWCPHWAPRRPLGGPQLRRRLGHVSRAGEDSGHARTQLLTAPFLSRRREHFVALHARLAMAALRSGPCLARHVLAHARRRHGSRRCARADRFTGTSGSPPHARRAVCTADGLRRRCSGGGVARARIRTRLRAGRVPGQGGAHRMGMLPAHGSGGGWGGGWAKNMSARTTVVDWCMRV